MKTKENTEHKEIETELSAAVQLRVMLQCCSYYFYDTHLDPHLGVTLSDHQVGTFIVSK